MNQNKFPNAFVILIGAICLAWVLTLVTPQGEYERVADEITGKVTVINGSYQEIHEGYLSLFDLFLSVPRGIIGRADLIVLILLLGGCFYVIEKTGALREGLSKVVHFAEGREAWALIAMSALFAGGGATIGLQDEVIAMMPVLLVFGRSLGFNAFSVIFMSAGSAVIGSSFSPSNPFSVIIAQEEAGLELLSGSGLRLLVLFIAFCIWVTYLIYYNRKSQVQKVAMSLDGQGITIRSRIILGLLGSTFAIVIYGLMQLEWGFNELSAAFFVLGIVSGLIGKLGINGTSEAYIAGFKEMIFAAIIVGLANSVSLLLQDGKVIDTIVYILFGPLEHLPASFSAVLMMFSHSVLHFPISSYSGQAILTMPILIPLSDLVGIPRQVCVLAYQYGAIIADLFVPTNGSLMAILAISGISFNRWIKFIYKPAILMLLVGAITIVVAIGIGYN